VAEGVLGFAPPPPGEEEEEEGVGEGPVGVAVA